jgi:multicomponent Na+:H+ antiporter subunit E
MNRFLHLPALVWRLLVFALWYFGQLVRSTALVARHVLAPRAHEVPGIVRVPLRSSRETHLALLTALVTLTPGTMVLEVHSEPPVVYVHGLQAPDAEALRRQVQEMEDRLLAAVHPSTRGTS